MTAIVTSRELKREAACRRTISRSFGCCQVPGEGGGCTFGLPVGVEVVDLREFVALVFARASGWTTVVEVVPDMLDLGPVCCWL